MLENICREKGNSFLLSSEFKAKSKPHVPRYVHQRFHCEIFAKFISCKFNKWVSKIALCFYSSHDRHHFNSHRIKVVLNGPGIPGPAVDRRAKLSSTVSKTNQSQQAANRTTTVTASVNKTLAEPNNSKTKPSSMKPTPTQRSTVASKYTNYDGHNLHDDLAFDWHPGISEVHYGDTGNYHNDEHEDIDSFVVQHGADIHGDRGWHAGHGENGYGYDTVRNHDNHGVIEVQQGGYGHGDLYGGENHHGGNSGHGGHYGGESHHGGDRSHGGHYGGDHGHDGHQYHQYVLLHNRVLYSHL